MSSPDDDFKTCVCVYVLKLSEAKLCLYSINAVLVTTSCKAQVKKNDKPRYHRLLEYNVHCPFNHAQQSLQTTVRV